MNIITGKIKPLHDSIFVSDMEFGEQRTQGGLVIQSLDGKNEGIHPRWGKVWAIGPEQKEVSLNEWVLVEHGRWARGIEVEHEDKKFIVRSIDTDAILMVSDEKPDDIIVAA
jgi:co-chaperonin GroES (HSP10)